MGGMEKSHAALLLLIGLVSPIWALPSAIQPTRPDVVLPLWGRWKVVRQEYGQGPEWYKDCGYFGWEFEFGDGWYQVFPAPWDFEFDSHKGQYWISQSVRPWTLRLSGYGSRYLWKIEGKYLYIIDVDPIRDWVPLNFVVSDGTFGLKDDLFVLTRVK
jgi:hypothetical protein